MFAHDKDECTNKSILHKGEVHVYIVRNTT